MKKYFVGSLVAAVLTISSFSVVGGQEPSITPPEKVNATPGMLTNMIDDVNVPWEILEYVQMKYEGHAVTKAEKINRFGKELYRLRVDRDSEMTDYDSMALLFDMQWKLIGEEKYATPPPAPKIEQKPATREQTAPTRTDGGRGAGSGDEETVKPKPEPPSTNGDDTSEPDLKPEPVEEDNSGTIDN